MRRLERLQIRLFKGDKAKLRADAAATQTSVADMCRAKLGLSPRSRSESPDEAEPGPALPRGDGRDA